MILILGAMDEEIDLLVKNLESAKQSSWGGLSRYKGSLFGREVLVAKSGVGKVMAAAVVQQVFDEVLPDFVIVTGLAGSLKAEIRIGDTVVAEDLVQHDLDTRALGIGLGTVPFTDIRFLAADSDLLGIAVSYMPAEGKVHLGRICTGDQFMTADILAQRPEIVAELSGSAVDMEGAAIALVCEMNGVPFLVARTVSDMADGSAHVHFSDFLPKASENSLSFVKHILTLA